MSSLDLRIVPRELAEPGAAEAPLPAEPDSSDSAPLFAHALRAVAEEEGTERPAAESAPEDHAERPADDLPTPTQPRESGTTLSTLTLTLSRLSFVLHGASFNPAADAPSPSVEDALPGQAPDEARGLVRQSQISLRLPETLPAAPPVAASPMADAVALPPAAASAVPAAERVPSGPAVAAPAPPDPKASIDPSSQALVAPSPLDPRGAAVDAVAPAAVPSLDHPAPPGSKSHEPVAGLPTHAERGAESVADFLAGSPAAAVDAPAVQGNVPLASLPLASAEPARADRVAAGERAAARVETAPALAEAPAEDARGGESETRDEGQRSLAALLAGSSQPAPASGSALPSGFESLVARAEATAAVSLPAAAPPTPAGSPAEVLPVHVEWLAARGGGTARLQLHPPDLGQIEIHVRTRGNVVEVRVRAQEPEALQLLGEQRLGLAEALAGRELRMEHFEVTHTSSRSSDASLGQSRSDAGQEGPAERYDTPEERSGDDPPQPHFAAPTGSLPAPAALPGASLSQHSGVDLRA